MKTISIHVQKVKRQICRRMLSNFCTLLCGSLLVGSTLSQAYYHLPQTIRVQILHYDNECGCFLRCHSRIGINIL